MTPLEQAIKNIQRLIENDYLSSEAEIQVIKNILKSFARTIVEQSVPDECSCFENALAGHMCEFNACRSQTLSNADNLLK